METHSDWLKGVSDDFMACRDLRHQWDHSGAFAARGNKLVRVLDCGRCYAQKWQVVEGGRVISTSMRFPDGYLKPKQVAKGRVARESILRESTGRHRTSSRLPADVQAFMERRGIKA